MADKELQRAVDGFYTALSDWLNGNPAPMLEVWSHADDITYMGPMGEFLVGWEKIKQAWLTMSKNITKGQVEAKDLHLYESGSLGVAVGHEDSVVYVDGELVKINLRATSVFRMEEGQFKMIAHHTDHF